MRLTLFFQKVPRSLLVSPLYVATNYGPIFRANMVNDDLLDSPWITAACKIQGDLNQVL